ncbi:glycoside hydrolase family protein [Planotetraspora sp. GP83]|uniref:glycoside hydrolase family protein n=1 Tax=Planotetraspora sp. GP83 TaxID=3156264 RepID=UPI0035172A0F
MTTRRTLRRKLFGTALLTVSLTLSSFATVTLTSTPAYATDPCATVPGSGGSPGGGGYDPEAPDPAEQGPQLTPLEMKAYVANNESTHGLAGDPHVYPDSKGHPTVGVGFNLDRADAPALLQSVGANYAAVRAGTQNLTPLQITTLFEGDFYAAIANVKTVIYNFDRLTSSRQVVLIDMMYNMGPGKFRQFTRMIGAVNVGDFYRAGLEMKNSTWATQVKGRATRDANLMQQGAVCDPKDVPKGVPTPSGGGGGATYPNGVVVVGSPFSGGGGISNFIYTETIYCVTTTVSTSGPNGVTVYGSNTVCYSD